MSGHGNTETQVKLPELTQGKYRRRLDVVVVVATFGGILFGYDTGVINGALEPMKAELGLTVFTEGVVTSSLLFAAAIGATIIGTAADRIGRRKVLLILAWVFITGTTACVVAPNLAVMVPGRIALGFAVGGASVTVPVYLAEMAPTEWRGRLSARNEVAVVVGQLLAFVFNALIHQVWGDHEGVWRYMLAVAAVPAILLFVGMLSMPESPRWLISKGRGEEAHKKHMSLGEALSVPWIRKLIVVGIGIAVIQQLTGINSIMFYGTQLLQNAGMSEDQAIVFNIGNGVLAVIGMYIGLRLIDKFPRRGMIQFGLVSVASLHLLIALLAAVLPDVEGSLVKPILIMVVVVTFVAIMQACLGLVVWVVLSELFPLKARGVAIGFSVFWMWIANGTVALTFPSLLDAFGINGTFLLFGIVNFLSFLFVRNYLPETGSLSLEELEAKFESEGVKVER